MSAIDDKITLKQAEAWTKSWRGKNPSACRAFLIPIQDLQGALNEIKAQGTDACARAYLAIDGAGTEKLVIVGTEKVAGKNGAYYKDLLPAASDVAGVGANSIWDFTQPCPPRCDEGSPLN